jgi:hypothetical protein
VSHMDQKTEQIADRLLAYLRQQLDDHSITHDLPLTRLSDRILLAQQTWIPIEPGKASMPSSRAFGGIRYGAIHPLSGIWSNVSGISLASESQCPTRQTEQL